MNSLKFEEQIKRLDPLNTLSVESFDKILGKLTIHEERADFVLFRQGENDKNYVYLIEGEVNLFENKSLHASVSAGADAALQPLAHSQPRHVSAIAKSRVVFCRIESQTLDMVIAWEQSKNYEVKEIPEHISLDSDDWLLRLLATPMFHRASASSLQTLFNLMQPQPVEKGQVIVSQGEPADLLYVIASGRASVRHQTNAHPDGMQIGILKPGDAFGEDGLISGKKRNATVTMLSKGMLLSVPGKVFNEQIEKPGIPSIDFVDAKALVAQGHTRWLDVRLPQEFKANHLPSAQNLPGILIRVKHEIELQHSYRYITVCDDGLRSSAAAFALIQRGYDALVLRGGLNSLSPTIPNNVAVN